MGLFDFLNPISKAIEKFLISTGLTVPAGSTIILFLISGLLAGFSGIVNRWLLDMEKMAQQNKEMAEHQRKKKLARETGDKKMWIRVKRNEERFLELQRNSMTTRMVPQLLTIGPLIFMFGTLRSTFQEAKNIALNGRTSCTSSCGVLAVLPFRISRSIPLIGKWFSPYINDPNLSVAGFGTWYFLSAISLSTILQKIFGINLSGMPNPMQQQMG